MSQFCFLTLLGGSNIFLSFLISTEALVLSVNIQLMGLLAKLSQSRPISFTHESLFEGFLSKSRVPVPLFERLFSRVRVILA